MTMPGRPSRRSPAARLRRHRAGMIGTMLLTILAVLALTGPLLSPHGLDAVDWAAFERPPSASHIFGTDSAGRDLFVRLMLATGISLLLGLLASLVSVVIGILWGAIAGFAGGRVDAVMMRLVDILYAMPFMFLVILLMVVFGRSIWLIFIGVGAIEWLTLARIVRGQTMQLKAMPFVEAARACGASPARIVARHIVPNLLGVVVIYATVTIPGVILTESVLSFLGLGIQEPMTSWGVLIHDGAAVMEISPWMLLFPVGLLSLTLYCFNYIGDGLRDALDPKDR